MATAQVVMMLFVTGSPKSSNLVALASTAACAGRPERPSSKTAVII